MGKMSGLSDAAAAAAIKAMKNSSEAAKRYADAIKSGEFGGTRIQYDKIQKNLSRFGRSSFALDNPLLSRESANKAMDAASREFETPAIRKARVKPIRR